MRTIKIDLADEIISIYGSEEKTAELMIRLSVLEGVRRKIISTGKGAELLDISILDFARLMKEHGIPYYDYSSDELEKEFEKADETLSMLNKNKRNQK